jgi:hypothetical protein
LLRSPLRQLDTKQLTLRRASPLFPHSPGGISKADLRRFLRWGAAALGYPALAQVEAARELQRGAGRQGQGRACVGARHRRVLAMPGAGCPPCAVPPSHLAGLAAARAHTAPSHLPPPLQPPPPSWSH